MNYDKKTYQKRENFPADLVVSGTFIAAQTEHRKWTKDGVEREMDVLCIFMQSDCGVFVCRCYDPKYSFADYKPGEPVFVPVNRYEVDGGLKTVQFRQG